MKLVTGKIQKAQRIVIYGPEGIGKSTLANQFPAPIFLDTEGSTNWMDVKRIVCGSWQDILDAIEYLKTNNKEFMTVVIDTADWAERLCVQHICNNHNKTSIEDFGYGKGYTYLAEEFGRMLTALNALINAGLHIVFVAHCTVKKMELPDEAGSFDHYEFKCSRQTSPLLKEWAEAVLFVNYKVVVTQDENKRTKAIGGRKRIIHSQHTAAYDAKNRWGLPDTMPFDLPFDFSVLGKYLTSKPADTPPAAKTQKTETPKPATASQPPPTQPEDPAKAPEQDQKPPENEQDQLDAPAPLRPLMQNSGIKVDELKAYCKEKNFIPPDGELSDLKTVVLKQMVLETNWAKVCNRIGEMRKTQEG